MGAVADVCQQLFGIAPGAMLLVCLLVFLAGYVDAIAGGGGLISLPAYMIAGLPTHAAIATNKMSSTMGTTIATWHYAKSGYIQWKLAGVCVVLAVAGSTIGSNLVLITSDAFLRVFLLAVLPITPVYWPDEKPGAENNVMKMIADHKFDLIVNIPKNHSKRELTNGYRIRRGAIDHNIPLITNARLASAFIEAFCELKLSDIQIKSWQEYK